MFTKKYLFTIMKGILQYYESEVCYDLLETDRYSLFELSACQRIFFSFICTYLSKLPVGIFI